MRIVRLDGGLFFATAEALEDRLRGLSEHAPRSRAVVLDLEGVDFVDAQGAAKLTDIHELLESEEVSLRLARVKPRVRDVIEADGIIGLIGADHIHGNVDRAVEAALTTDEQSTGSDRS